MRARLLVILSALAAAPAAHAQGYRYPPPQAYGPRESGLYIGGKIGIGFPNGDLSADSGAVGDTVTAKVPFGFELGARLNRMVRLGVFGDLAPAGVKDAACGQSSCSGTDSRVGVDAQFHLAPFTAADPWIGLGFAYEWLSLNGVGVTLLNGAPAVVDETWSGGQFLLEGGVDFPVAPQFTMGPYLGLEFGRFGSYSNSVDGSYSPASTASHGWVTIGVKGTFLL